MSMTGFACQSVETSWGSLLWELKTVNHRFLEVNLRLPDGLKELESAVRLVIQQQVKRGKVDATLKFTPGTDSPYEMVLNEPLLTELAQSSAVLRKFFPDSVINQVDLLQWPGVLAVKEKKSGQVNEAALHLLDKTIVELQSSREREGASIAVFLKERLAAISVCAAQIEVAMPKIREQVRAKTLARFAELSLEVNSERLEQEMVWLVQKIDVAEELQRLGAHVSEFLRVLQEGSVIGRRLDFLTQELNREANTLGSKSLVSAVTQASVELKVQIEQIREQVQNIE
jgi:uncharacterized protein (TIGR00255 family)